LAPTGTLLGRSLARLWRCGKRLYADPSIQHAEITRLRALNVTQLWELDKTLVIQDNDNPQAVLLKYEHFLAMQEKILKYEEQ
jgi:hypothetical protein